LKNIRIPYYLLFSLLFLWPMQAAAVVPTVDELLTSITARRIYIQSLEAVYEYDGSASRDSEAGAAGNGSPVQETIFYSAPDRIRLNLTWRDKEEVFLAVGSKTLALAVAETEKAAWPQPFLLFRLLVDSDVVRLRELLITSGINLQKIAIERHHGRIVYVLGTRSGGRERSQVWFDRETLRLTRLIIWPDQNLPVYDLELTDYRLHEKKIDWPGILISKRDSGPTEHLRLKTLTIDPKLIVDSLDQDEKKPDESSAPPDPEEILARDPEVVKIRKMVESFRKKLE
jgi:hypothetical protein